ncbi:helix-turn-helix transcriptional regulator [Lactobacillus sp. 3B(2020)]|uniref:helix-turn-helix transcriptional regulator n=1 Tax=Lactobacillus sp. 3B(2020) TaxID=2695882 RepID=UPI0021073C32|nr:helix-turn-helix transcriptional regulator [Lactobacillus sp. 3B(2020)]
MQKYTIKAARIRAGFTQREVAHKLHMNVQTFMRIENGKSYFRINSAAKFADIVGIDFDNIIFF